MEGSGGPPAEECRCPFHSGSISRTSRDRTRWPRSGEEAFLKAALETNTWTPKSQIQVFADGADGLTNLVSAAADQTINKVLDWFPISMHLRPIEQISSRIALAAAGVSSTLNESLSKNLPRTRY